VLVNERQTKNTVNNLYDATLCSFIHSFIQSLIKTDKTLLHNKNE